MMYGKLPSGPLIAVDTETNGLHPFHGDQPFMVTLCNEDGESCAFEWPVDPMTRKVRYDKKEVAVLKAYLEYPRRRFIFHNAKFDVRMLEMAMGIHIRHACVEDTMFAAHCCNTLEYSYELKYLCKRKIDYPDDDEKELESAVKRYSRQAAKYGWALAYKESETTDGSIKRKRMAKADYWIPGMMARLHPETFATSEDRTTALSVCRKYAVKDVERTMLLWKYCSLGMVELDCLHTYEMEMRQLWPVVYRMETRGVAVDLERCKSEKDRCRKIIDDLLPGIKKQVPWDNFNVDSHPQLSKFLFNILGLPVAGTTPTGAPSTRFKDMDALDISLPVVQDIIKVRTSAKAINAFFGRFLSLSVPDNEHGGFVIHPSFKQRGPVTTRFACSDPSIQNLSSGDSASGMEPIYARAPFGPRPGFGWLMCDWSNIEVRLFAFFAREMNMLEALWAGRNIHTEVCNRVWGGVGNPLGIADVVHALEIDGTGKPEKDEKVLRAWKELGVMSMAHRFNAGTMDQAERWKIAMEWLNRFKWDIVAAEKELGKVFTRVKAKALTFTKIYGGGYKAVAHRLKITLEAAKSLLNAYDRQYPRIRAFIYEMEKQAGIDGYVLTPWHDRITVHKWDSYVAVNYIVQGSAAMVMKRAMISVAEWLEKERPNTQIIMTIHDEIAIEAPLEDLTVPFVRTICKLMADAGSGLDVALPVEPKIVLSNWSEKKTVDVGKGYFLDA